MKPLFCAKDFPKFWLVLIAAMLFLAACGGGGGGGGESGDPKNLAIPASLKSLFDRIYASKDKGDFETTEQYDARLNSFAARLAGYRATLTVDARYDADSGELRIDGPPPSVSSTYDDSSDGFYPFNTTLFLQNWSDLYQSTTRQETDYRGDPYTAYYYAIVSMSSSEAQRLIDGFRVDYTFSFSGEQLKNASFTSCYESLHRCYNDFYGDAVTYRVYNTVNGMTYPPTNPG